MRPGATVSYGHFAMSPCSRKIACSAPLAGVPPPLSLCPWRPKGPLPAEALHLVVTPSRCCTARSSATRRRRGVETQTASGSSSCCRRRHPSPELRRILLWQQQPVVPAAAPWVRWQWLRRLTARPLSDLVEDGPGAGPADLWRRCHLALWLRRQRTPPEAESSPLNARVLLCIHSRSCHGKIG